MTTKKHFLSAFFVLGLLLTPVAALTQEREIYMAFFGDAGSGSENQKAVAGQLRRVEGQNKLDHVFLLGDNIYPKGEVKHFQAKFFEPYRGIRAPFHAALGNHDVKTCKKTDPSGNADFNAYPGCSHVKAQLTEQQFGYADGRRYYTLPVGGNPPLIEVFALDTNTLDIRGYKGNPDIDQLSWLEKELGDSKATWKIVTMHNPLRSPQGKGLIQGHKEELGLQRQLEKIFAANNVDAVFQGHNHFYARIHPQRGIRYFVAGGGGNDIYKFRRDTGNAVNRQDQGRFHHFVHVRVTPDAFQYCTVDSDGSVRDAGWFKKGDREDTTPSDGACPF